MKKLLTFFLLIAIGFSLGSCTQNQQQSYAEDYLKKYAAKDFKACYALLSADSISEDKFIEKLNAIFNGLKIQKVDFEKPKTVQENGRTYCDFKMTYHSDYAEDLVFDYRMSFVKSKEGAEKILWEPNLIFPQMEEGDTVRIAKIDAARGEIFAKDGSLLAANVSLPCFYAVPDKITDVESAASSVAALLGLKAQDVSALIKSDVAKRDGYIVLKSYKSFDEISQKLKASVLAIPGMGFDSTNYVRVRQYPLAEAFAHTVGYVGTISAEEYEKLKGKGYEVDELVGKEGLELAYEEKLHGTDGYQIIIVTSAGNKRATLYKKDAQNGLDLRLSIDSSLQQTAYDSLKANVKEGQSAVAIVMDPETGFVEAIANYPSYDPNDFIGGISKEKWQQLSSEKANKPMFNRCLQGLYTPGSTLKPFTAVAALDSKTITFNTVYNLNIKDDVWIPESGWKYAAIRRTESPAHQMSLSDCLIWSDNIFFAKAALEMGAETFMRYFDQFGFGTTIPFDLKVSKAQYKDDHSEMNPGLLADSAFGQGELQITPLQMAASFAAFVNQGNIMQPRIVRSLMQTDGRNYTTAEEFTATVWRKNSVPPSLCAKLLPVMEKVISEGTGQRLRATGVSRVAGKTGTAQVSKEREIGWFIAFWVNEDDPRLVLTLVDGKPEELGNKFDIARPLLSKQK